MSAGCDSRLIGLRLDIMRLSRPWSLGAGRRRGWCGRAVPQKAARCVEMLQLDDFAEKVALSGLVPTVELTQAKAQVEPEPAADASVRLARLLVQQGLLTTYQTRKLLAGATRGFFLGGYRILSPAVD